MFPSEAPTVPLYVAGGSRIKTPESHSLVLLGLVTDGVFSADQFLLTLILSLIPMSVVFH